jgi:predicted transcriptional regulator
MAAHPEIEEGPSRSRRRLRCRRQEGGSKSHANSRSFPSAQKPWRGSAGGSSTSSRCSPETPDRNSKTLAHSDSADWGTARSVLPKSVALSHAKRELRLVQYQQAVALREQGFSQTAIAQQVGISHATVSRWLRHGSFPEQKPRPRSASVDRYLPQLVAQWKAGSHTVAELHRELVANGYAHQYNSVYRRLARSFPEGQKKRLTHSVPSGLTKQEASDQLAQPPVRARQAAFLFRASDIRPLGSRTRNVDVASVSAC